MVRIPDRWQRITFMRVLNIWIKQVNYFLFSGGFINMLKKGKDGSKEVWLKSPVTKTAASGDDVNWSFNTSDKIAIAFGPLALGGI